MSCMDPIEGTINIGYRVAIVAREMNKGGVVASLIMVIYRLWRRM